MVESYLRQSPLAHLHLDTRATDDNSDLEAGVMLMELPYRVMITLRGSSTDKAFITVVGKVLATNLPLGPCTSSGDANGVHVLWMGPDEWLIVAPKSEHDGLALKLTSALAGVHASVVDVSESRTIIRLSGKNARETLSKGCSIDLHHRAFNKGQVINSLLAQAHVTLHQGSNDEDANGTAYDIFVHRSFAEYLWSWLEDATQEFGLRITTE